ncbi:MAG TPA: cyclic 2,3-diphosphoglycerate synthase [Burkholderiales bacterium]|nr:cyclic 2,3-diphosphoglycerate synthase [Burkholderiales bacterium]
MTRRRILIMGAAGRDFHDFNVVYRNDPACEVVAFTAAQIPGIAGRRYPPSLAGPLYPQGIPIVAEDELEARIRADSVDLVVLAYSDLAHVEVMHRASRALAAGADFALLGPRSTMVRARLPVIAVTAVRTGAGKSPLARWLAARLRARGLRAAVVRHPMPYGDLERQVAQRFATRADLDAARCTLEEREEYEPHIAAGGTVYAGVDTARVIALAERESDIILWDGGNNDFPFVRPGLHIVVVDPLRAGDETRHHPGETCLRTADVVVVSKVDSASTEAVAAVTRSAKAANPRAPVLRAALEIRLDDPAAVRGKRVLVVEDGPTVTHGGMPYGAGYLAAQRAGAAEIVDPRASAAQQVRAVYDRYPHLGRVLPALGYSDEQLEALRRTIEDAGADAVVAATPVDFGRLMDLHTPVVRARYEFVDLGTPGLGKIVDEYLDGLTRTCQ